MEPETRWRTGSQHLRRGAATGRSLSTPCHPYAHLQPGIQDGSRMQSCTAARALADAHGTMACIGNAQSCEMNGQARSLRPSPPEGTGWIENQSYTGARVLADAQRSWHPSATHNLVRRMVENEWRRTMSYVYLIYLIQFLVQQHAVARTTRVQNQISAHHTDQAARGSVVPRRSCIHMPASPTHPLKPAPCGSGAGCCS